MSTQLESYRQQIDALDTELIELIELLKKRFEITRKVGELKRSQNIAPIDRRREQTIINKMKSLAENANIPPNLAEQITRSIIDEVVKEHTSE